MSATSREVLLDFVNGQGRKCGVLRLVQADTKSDSIRVLTAAEAKEYGEEVVQLLEGRVYDFEVFDTVGNLRIRLSRVAKPNSIKPNLGRIETGVETGLLSLILEDSGTGSPVAKAQVEVRSSKISYREDYRGMLNFIAGECSELLFDIRASTQMRIAPNFKKSVPNLQQLVEFLAAELTSGGFFFALQRVVAVPHQKLQTTWEEQSVSRLRKGSRDLSRQLGSARARQLIPTDHPIGKRMSGIGIASPSLPRMVLLRNQTESFDTPENRFVKHVLTHFRDFLKVISSLLKKSRTADSQRYIRVVQHLEEQLHKGLSQDFFKEISDLQVLPLGSPVLQRKAGYREILLTWLKFGLASDLIWNGGDDVYGAGKRDMATLYEYWLFFQLLRLFREKFALESPATRNLFEHSEGGLHLRLRVDEPFGIKGRCTRESRQLNVRFHYNLTHNHSDARAESGSWTRRMRPDFTLSFWPDNFDLGEAEAQELAVHIHFDAKYRVENITQLFGEEDDDLNEEKSQQKNGNYKRADLLKMHAYRDAIRRSEGAYILYPGDKDSPTHFSGFHEILPGLGAFPIRPGSDGEGIGLQQLSRFLDEVILHVCNRATAREQSSFHHFNIYRKDELNGVASINAPIPETNHSDNIRPIPPSEHSVLVGWCSSDEHLDWFCKMGLYNFRAGSRRGSIRLAPEIAGARHLMLHTHGGKALPGLWRIKVRGPRIFTADELVQNKYPSDPDQNAIYAVFDIELDTFYKGWEWDYSKLKGRKTGHSSAEPFAVSLIDVLDTHV